MTREELELAIKDALRPPDFANRKCAIKTTADVASDLLILAKRSLHQLIDREWQPELPVAAAQKITDAITLITASQTMLQGEFLRGDYEAMQRAASKLPAGTLAEELKDSSPCAPGPGVAEYEAFLKQIGKL